MLDLKQGEQFYVNSIPGMGHSIPTQPKMEVIISEFDENWLDERYI